MSSGSERQTAVAEAEPVVMTEVAPRQKTEGEPRSKQLPPFHVIILNDEEHTFDYVIELLTKLFRHPLNAAIDLTWKIHLSGRAVVFTTHKEKAELKRDQVLAYGPDPRMSISKSSLGCYIEPAVAD